MEPILTISETISRGSKRKDIVRLVQEWLNLHGSRISIDGEFGPATEAAVKEFQEGR
ncbi:MAG: peptidoglycan-binding domain-containing protein [Nitrospiraceae bacterium]